MSISTIPQSAIDLAVRISRRRLELGKKGALAFKYAPFER
jgi:hypothetical protein